MTDVAVKFSAAIPSSDGRAVPRKTLFILFFLSGFASLIYQIVWTRMAFAYFGILTPVLSVVLSVFMLGLAVGSFAGGRLIAPMVRKTGISAVFFYGAAEFLIGISAFAVPYLFSLSARLLLSTGQMDSVVYLLLSAAALAISIFPWCVCMGTTFPFMMAFVRQRDPQNAKSFSFLYVANVLGAMSGIFLGAFAFIELFGFHGTLNIAAGANFFIAVVSAFLGATQKQPAALAADPVVSSFDSQPAGNAGFIKLVLFSTGFIAMAMEVVWSRAFVVVLQTQVYSFAGIVFAYLGATFLGSLVYRSHLRRKYVAAPGVVFCAIAFCAFLPVLLNDSRVVRQSTYDIDLFCVTIILLSICPFCALLGYLTPRLIDDYSAGSPAKAGEAYAINVIGSIIGPLAACYLLLPWVSDRNALIILSLPLLGFWIKTIRSQPRIWRIAGTVATLAAAGQGLVFSSDFERALFRREPEAVVRRDYAASVISSGTGHGKALLVNGIGMTSLSPVTKFMAHLPLAFYSGQPKSALIICFGMGTSYRSALSWNIDTTAVELVPGVVGAFDYYFDDADKCLANPHSHVVIDDGRRYLNRCNQKFDVVIVDPPPPLGAAGSSLLFSREFYALVKEHMNPNGVIQVWAPDRPPDSYAAIRSISNVFPHVRCFSSMYGWGLHMVASMAPLPPFTPVELAAKMPPAAQRDLVEWDSTADAAGYLNLVLSRELPVTLDPNPRVEITDDRPFNEYFLIRNFIAKHFPPEQR